MNTDRHLRNVTSIDVDDHIIRVTLDCGHRYVVIAPVEQFEHELSKAQQRKREQCTLCELGYSPAKEARQ